MQRVFSRHKIFITALTAFLLLTTQITVLAETIPTTESDRSLENVKTTKSLPPVDDEQLYKIPSNETPTFIFDLDDGEDKAKANSGINYMGLFKYDGGKKGEEIHLTREFKNQAGGFSGEKEAKASITVKGKVKTNGDYIVETSDVAGNESNKTFRVSHIFRNKPEKVGTFSVEGSKLKDDSGLSKIPKINEPQEISFVVNPERWDGYKEGDVINKIVDAKVVEIEYDEQQVIQRADNKAITKDKVEVINEPQGNDEGRQPSILKFTADHSADYTIEYKDEAGNTNTTKVKVMHIDYRVPVVDKETDKEINDRWGDDGDVNGWTNDQKQEITIKYRSPSGTKFFLLDEQDKVVDFKEDGTAYYEVREKNTLKDLEKHGFSKSDDNALVATYKMTPKGPDKEGFNVTEVHVVMFTNRIYKPKVKDSVSTIGHNINVRNFDWDKAQITIKKSEEVSPQLAEDMKKMQPETKLSKSMEGQVVNRDKNLKVDRIKDNEITFVPKK